MKIIEPRVEAIIERDPLKKIEIAGRTCYKSESKIGANSAEKFVADIIKRKHESVTEHANFILRLEPWVMHSFLNTVRDLENNGVLVMQRVTKTIVSGNARMWRDLFRACEKYERTLPGCIRQLTINNPVLFPEFMSSKIFDECWSNEPILFLTNDDLSNDDRLIHACETFRIICDRGVSHEIVRHRRASFSQESTRYCNYGKEGFGGEITVIRPSTFAKTDSAYRIWKRACENAETAYFDLLNEGCTPQEARSVLQNSLKTEIVMTATLEVWQHFCRLRCPATAHPDMRVVANMLLTMLKQTYPVFFEDI